MLGWMILFALLTITGALTALGNHAPLSALVCLTFGFLFVVGLLTRLVRGRTW